MRILAVEDEHAYAVDIAADGDTALEQVGVNDYDLVILDVLLPGINGLDLCRQLRAEGYTPALEPFRLPCST